jgi:hypothetical protein
MAPVKREGAQVIYDDTIALPYAHPKYIVPKHLVGKKYKGVNRKWRVQHAAEVREAARNYFGQELMLGAKIEELKKDSFWHYMED